MAWPRATFDACRSPRRPAGSWECNAWWESCRPDCILVGYSMGARLALACALTEPDRLSGLVLVSGSPGLPAAQRAARWEHDQQLAARLRSQNPREFLLAWYSQPVFQGLSAECAGAIGAREICRSIPSTNADLLRSYSVGRQPDYWARLETLRLPVLIVVGQQDAKYVALAHRMAGILPLVRLHVVPQAGHVVHREQPHRLVAAIRESLNWLAHGGRAATQGGATAPETQIAPVGRSNAWRDNKPFGDRSAEENR